MCRVARPQQTDNSEEIAEIEQIFLNLPSVKNVRVKIKATFFGRDWARTAPQAYYHGTVTSWKNKGEKTIYVLWEGWGRNKAHAISDLLKPDDDGESVEFELLPYEYV